MRDPWELAGIQAGDHVLSVGFRDSGELLALGERAGPTGLVAGIDLDPQRVRAVRDELTRLSLPNVTVDQGSLLDIPFGDRSFDLVFCKGVLHEIRRMRKALKEMARVCSPDGLVCLIDVTRFSRLRFEVYRIGVWVRGRRTGDVHPGFARERLLELLERTGLEEEHY